MTTRTQGSLVASAFRLNAVQGIIDRRILVNFRCDPKPLGRLLPAPFRPGLVRGFGIAGVCLIRLRDIRPTGLPSWLGVASENAAHRVAVEWDENGEVKEGVFIPRRDSDSILNAIAGDRLFPGHHHRATFRVVETDQAFNVEMKSADGSVSLDVSAVVAERPSAGSVFETLEDASDFFQRGALGWSTRRDQRGFDGLKLSCTEWHMVPLAVERVQSSFFSNIANFPPGAAEFDSAFLMRSVPHEWHARGVMDGRFL